MSHTLAIVTNYKRPANVSAIVAALREQTVRPTIVVVDNAPDSEHQYRGPADDVWRFSINHGPPCRWAPALLDFYNRYTLLLDDDLLPGRRAVEACTQAARELRDHFATLGVIGRRYKVHPPDPQAIGPYEYQRRNVRRNPLGYEKVDLTCRAHFMVTQRLPQAVLLRHTLVRSQWFSESLLSLVSTHDDILLCQSLQMGVGSLPSYLLPSSLSADQSLRRRELPAGRGASARPMWEADRSRLINYLADLGWRSLVP